VDYTVIIPYYNGYDTLPKLVETLPTNVPIVVVNDKSEQPVPDSVVDDERVKILDIPEKGYFTGAVNWGMRNTTTDVLILNQDVWFESDVWQTTLVESLALGSPMIGEGIMGTHPAWPKGYIQGTFMYVTRKAIEGAGYMDAGLYPLWGSTCDYQLRVCRSSKISGLPTVLDVIPGMKHRDGIGQRYGDAINSILRKEPKRRREFIRTPPEISIIVPCRNYGRYLYECLNSIFDQTLQSTEVIVVDDYSEDETPQIMNDQNWSWLGVKYHRTPNQLGTAAAINIGIKASHGRIITILSADDKMESRRLYRMYDALQIAPPKTFVYDDIIVFGSRALLDFPNDPLYGSDMRIHTMRDWSVRDFLYKNGAHAGIMYPKQAWVDAGGYPEEFNNGREDWAFNIALINAEWRGFHINEPGYMYRRDGQNRSLSNSTKVTRQEYLRKLYRRFPNLYAIGDVNMAGCNGCGDSSPQLLSNNKWIGGIKTLDVPDGDWVELEYIGPSALPQTYQGLRTSYYFGGKRVFGFVQAEDVKALLSKRSKNNELLFRMPQHPGSSPAVEAIDDEYADDALMDELADDALLDESESDSELAPIILTDSVDEPEKGTLGHQVMFPWEYTVKDLRAVYPQLTPEQAQVMRSRESDSNPFNSRVTLLDELNRIK